jgi:hypothetical protein
MIVPADRVDLVEPEFWPLIPTVRLTVKPKQRSYSNKRLEHLQRLTFDYFLKEANPHNGLVRDSTRQGAPCSITPTGFALAAYPVGVERGFITRDQAIERTLATLRFLWTSEQSTGPGETGSRVQQPWAVCRDPFGVAPKVERVFYDALEPISERKLRRLC